MLTRKTTHAIEARARLLHQLQDVAGLKILLDMFDVHVQEIEDVLWDLHEKRSDILTAIFAQLDNLGRLLAEPRDGAGDLDYRERLKAKIRVLRSSGTAPNLIKVFKLLLPNNNIIFEQLGGAGFILNIGQVNAAFVPIYIRFVRQAKSGGINAQLIYTTSDPAIAFTFSANPDPTVLVIDAAKGFGDIAGTTGGHFSNISI